MSLLRMDEKSAATVARVRRNIHPEHRIHQGGADHKTLFRKFNKQKRRGRQEDALYISKYAGKKKTTTMSEGIKPTTLEFLKSASAHVVTTQADSGEDT